MIDMGELGRLVWRDWMVDGVPSSGSHQPMKQDIRTFVAAIDLQKGHVFADVAALRLHQGDATTATIVARTAYGDGQGGAFAVDAADTVTADDGQFVIVDRLGRRWKRVNAFVQRGTGAVLRQMRDKLREVEVSVEDYHLAIDADDTNAINRAIAAIPANGGTITFNRNVNTPYNISAAIVITRGNITLHGKHHGVVTINSTSTTANHFTIGAVASTYLFNIHIHKFVFTRSHLCSAGRAIDCVNVGYSTFERLRIFGDNKQYQGLRFRSCNSLYLSRIRTENIQKEAGWFEGLSARTAALDGNIINLFIEDWYNSGSHAHSTSLATQGAIVFKDFCQGIWIDEYASDSHKGYALYLAGTLANRAENTLIHVTSLDVESGKPSAGALRIDGYANVWVDTEWVSGKDLNTVHIGQDATGVYWARGDVAIGYDGAEAAAFFVDGQVVSCGARMVGYSTNAHSTGISIGPHADIIDFHAGAVVQVATGLAVHVSSRTGKKIALSGTRFYSNRMDCNFDLTTTAHDLHIDCPGLPVFLRGDVNLGGSGISASMRVVAHATNVNGLEVHGAEKGATPGLLAKGQDTDVGLFDQTKGAGVRGFRSQDGAKLNLELLGTNPAGGSTILYVRYHNGSVEKYENIGVGDVDSGGTGYRTLRLPN
jgi:hypothetical protein